MNPTPPRPADPALRLATRADIPLLEPLIARSARALSPDYTPAQIESALGTAWGVDTELIDDGSYFVIELAGALAACGGWSRRHTLFGASALPGRISTLLDPAVDAARIRAFFVDPVHARRGLGRLLLATCESAALAAGFTSTALVATLPGVRLYAAHGYVPTAPIDHPLPNGDHIAFIAMRKQLAIPSS